MKKKILAVMLSALFAATFLVGCNKNKIDDSEDNLIIEYYQAGYGDAGFVALQKEFERRNPGKTVTLIPNSGLISSNAEAKIGAGPSVTAVDLFFCGDLNIRSIIDKGANVVKGYDVALEDLSDLYNSDIDGVKYKDKMMEYYSDYNKNGGKYYSTNWATGANGLAYRVDFFEKEGWEIPATTDELKELISKMKEKGYVPFTWPGGTGYWAYLTQVWWAQYAGEDEMSDFYNGIAPDLEVSPDCFHTLAFYETYKALEDCIGDTTNSFSGSISFGNHEAQNKMLIDANKICMMPNGAWMENEVGGSGGKLGMMKAPLLSSVLYTDEQHKRFRFETITSEETLRAVVKATDAGEDGLEGVSAEDYSAVRDMRNYVTTTGTLLQAVIPVYANAKPLAKEFLKLLASDEGMQLFYDACGAVQPFDTKGLTYKANATTFEKNVFDMTANAKWLALNCSKNRLFYKTELDFVVKVPEIYIGSESEKGRKTAKEFFDFQYEYVSGYWSHYKQLAGV